MFDRELLFLNTRLSVKVKLPVFNLVKAIQSCREEVKISSKTDVNFLNATLVLTVITLSKQTQGKPTTALIQYLSNSYRDKQGRGGRGRELEQRLSQNVFSSLTVHLADIIIFGNVLLLKVFAVTRYEVVNDRKPSSHFGVD